ncbi:MAG: DUF1847 domain-containing protein [Deltaproteobacteria bacterium]|nr:DUF1847 domain-containing protein [Deltaproteobacteria bacterium]MBW1921644.1 DUF1847 domain-containing protein [Deltaproteobacteria bacterium]MBW1936840.1 DUF1847 domain-containing protein [Deltaproteobacteria bacterium]MBW1978719.1 DUF1847 domain-containing protein [Deltaproteobacteria bacterium]MBW2046733.1 DUF1847 domain-containing protein [Deltaproteobacteria bacterium]
MNDKLPNCAKCSVKLSERACRKENGKGPAFCPTLYKKEIIEKSLQEYEHLEIKEFARQASIQEAQGYGDKELGYARVRPIKPRIVEVMEFAQKMGYKRLGLVFCIGLRKEAQAVEMVFSKWGFEVVSVVCKAGRTPKEKIGIRDDQKIAIGQFESMCNPIMQAMVLNDSKTDFNVVMGLCVGHDSLFLKYAEAPCTVLAVKDRLLGHNPLAAIYNIDSYYRSLKNRPS